MVFLHVMASVLLLVLVPWFSLFESSLLALACPIRFDPLLVTVFVSLLVSWSVEKLWYRKIVVYNDHLLVHKYRTIHYNTNHHHDTYYHRMVLVSLLVMECPLVLELLYKILVYTYRHLVHKYHTIRYNKIRHDGKCSNHIVLVHWLVQQSLDWRLLDLMLLDLMLDMVPYIDQLPYIEQFRLHKYKLSMHLSLRNIQQNHIRIFLQKSNDRQLIEYHVLDTQNDVSWLEMVLVLLLENQLVLTLGYQSVQRLAQMLLHTVPPM